MPLDLRQLEAALGESDDAPIAMHARPTFARSDLYGPVGDLVRLIAPHSEASPVTIYVCALVTCGALLGRGPTWRFAGADHHARLFAVLVGETGSGRKGTAMAEGMRRLLRAVDPDFAAARLVSGLSSAEGLIAELRDATPDREVLGKVIPGDPGVDDKRLLVAEGELGSALEAMGREGNRLSAILRDAWDGADLRSLVKKDPQRATAPHVCVIGGITPTELRTLMTSGSVLNGLANRFLAVHAARAQLLSRDTAPDPRALDEALRLIRDRVTTARAIARVAWTPAGADRWDAEYPRLAVTEDPSPLVRALLERGAPMTRRLAMLLALLDGTGAVDVPHLEAALAVWRFSAATWRHLYARGERFSPLADRLRADLEGAGPAGLTRSQLRERIGTNTPAEQIVAALRELADAGIAHRHTEPTAGRPRERWHHALHGRKEENEERKESPPSPVLDCFNPFPLKVGARLIRVTLDDGTELETRGDDPDLAHFAGRITRLEALEAIEDAA